MQGPGYTGYHASTRGPARGSCTSECDSSQRNINSRSSCDGDCLPARVTNTFQLLPEPPPHISPRASITSRIKLFQNRSRSVSPRLSDRLKRTLKPNSWNSTSRSFLRSRFFIWCPDLPPLSNPSCRKAARALPPPAGARCRYTEDSSLTPDFLRAYHRYSHCLHSASLLPQSKAHTSTMCHRRSLRIPSQDSWHPLTSTVGCGHVGRN